MNILQAVVLGITQGISEPLPISSSAHLVFIPWFFGWPYQGLTFDVALHLGTAAAFVIYFFNDWLKIVDQAFTKDLSRKSLMLWWIVLGTIPAAIAGLILEKKAETVFRSPLLIGVMLAVFAVILFFADRSGKKQKSISQMNLSTVIAIGLAQVLAIVPGVSRSGITITAGLFTGLTREAAARFSFLLATPIVVAAGVLKLYKLDFSHLGLEFWLGVLCSLISGLISIHFLLKFVKRFSLNWFVGYRIVLAGIVVWLCLR